MFALMAGSNARRVTAKEQSSRLDRAHDKQQKRATDDRSRIGSRNSGQTAEAKGKSWACCDFSRD